LLSNVFFGSGQYWQAEEENAAPLRGRSVADLTTVGLHDHLGNGQAQARPQRFHLGLMDLGVFVEKDSLMIVADTRPLIGDSEFPESFTVNL
jgi:hypothetical protein